MNDKELMAILKFKDEMSKTIKEVNRNLKDMKTAQGEAEKANNSLSNTIKANSKTMIKAGGAMAAAFGAIAFTTVKDAMSFESAFTGVVKTFDDTGLSAEQATEALAGMRKEILEMSTKVPASAEEIAGVAEVAGQLGIQRDSIMGFTKTIIDLGEATNLVGEEGASQLAKFANITGMSQDNFDKLGSTIVDLGNKMATTEADIVNMAMRLAGAGSQIGLSEAQIMSFSAALSSVGIEAEMGGSAFSKVMIDMQLAVETGNKKLEGFAKTAGMSASQFKKAFQDDAAGAIVSFLKGIGNAEASGQSAIKMLDDLGIKEVRLRDTILRASSASDLFNKSLDIGTQAWKDNIALTNEAETRYGTTESQLAMMKNQIRYASIEIGTALLPMVRDLTEFLGGLASAFNNLEPEQKEFISKVVLGGVVIGGIITVIGLLGLAISGLGFILALITSPITVFILAIAAIGMAVVSLKKMWDTNWNGIKDKTLEVVDKVKGYWEGLKEFLKHPITGTINFIKKGVDDFTSQAKGLKEKNAKGNAFGSGRIARNDELRRLHEGEKVLTKGEADRYEKGTSNDSNVIVQVNGLTVREEADIDRIANAFMRKLNQSKITVAGGA